MNPLAAALTTGALVVAGKWSQDKVPDLTNAIGIAGIAIGLSVIQSGNKKLAEAFGWVIVLSMTVIYLPPIVRGAGLTTGRRLTK